MAAPPRRGWSSPTTASETADLMNGLTRVFLVLLRLAIGWHFLVEGLEKIHSVNLGPTESNRPWTSEPYLREASGPISGLLRAQIGDLDEAALARLTPVPLDPNQDPARIPARQRIPAALEQDWDSYFERFVQHYRLTEEQRQLAAVKLDQAKEQAGRWLLGQTGVREIDKTFGTSTVKVKETPATRIENYRTRVQQVRDALDKELPAFNRDVWKQKLRVTKAEIGRLRAELLAEQNAILTEALASVLSDEQQRLGPVPPAAGTSQLVWIDRLTRYGLTAVGVGLLLGLFTRLACLGGAAFLLLFYLTMPPFPWLPTNPVVEGHYVFVNKNLIEMLALLVLATTPSGRWVGLDGLLRFLNPWRRRAAVAAPTAE